MPISNDTSRNDISLHVDRLALEIKQEKAKGKNADYNVIAALLLERSIFIDLGVSRTFSNNLQKLTDLIHKNITQIEKNYENSRAKYDQKAVALLSVISGFGSGLASGSAGFLPKDVIDFNSKAQSVLNGIGAGSQAIGSGYDKYSNIHQTKKAGEREILNKTLDENKSLADEARRAAEEADRNKSSAENTLKEMRNAQEAMARVVAGG